MDLCLKHNTDCLMNLVGSRTNFNVLILLHGWFPVGSSCILVYMPAGCLDNVFVLYSSVDVLKGWLDSFSFGCLNVGVCLSCSQGVSLN